MSSIIGIDLGTTNSLCSVFSDDGPALIPNSEGKFLTPSVIGVLKDGQILVGAAARELSITQPERCAWCFKRWMGTEKKVELGEHTFSAPELSSLVLKALKTDAQAHLDGNVTEAVITVPAYFNEHQRRAAKLAGELAGLKVRRIINEPTAAALTYGFHDQQSDKKLLVFDLGGGTFDVTLMEIFEGTLEIISTAGESFLGGEDFTDQIIVWALAQEKLQLELVEFKEPLRLARLRQECEQAKKAMANGKTSTIPIPHTNGRIDDKCPRYDIDPSLFAQRVEGLMERLAQPVAKSLRDGECTRDDVADIILVGGATRMPVIREFVQEYFDRSPLIKYNPDEVVALGAAVQTALIQDHKAVGDLVMTDVCPFTLGIDISKVFGKQIRDGYFLPIIHRNTTIPVTKEEIVATTHPNQREIAIKIYQGESRKVKGNLLLGELSVTGLPPGPAGTPVHVRFTYDLNGILDVEAFVPDTGKKFHTVLTQHVKDLAPHEIRLALKKMDELKFYPRDDLNNRQLVLFCERILGEINRYEREELEALLDQFEDSMYTRDRDYFEAARQGLLIALSRLGFPFEEKPRGEHG